ncbi:MAG TPA: hypothetical protein VFY12_11285 [Arenimonas sp.]|nr:hypothetical protein [Arenimonas sp.]
MTDHLKLILTLIGLWLLAASLVVALALGVAGTSTEQALLAGLLLPSFGAAIAQAGAMLVALPLGVLTVLLRVMRGRKPVQLDGRVPDRVDRVGRYLFVAGYGLLSAATGLWLGVVGEGSGALVTALLLGLAGLLVASRVPYALVWSGELDSQFTGSEPTAAGREDLAKARERGVPAVLWSDRIAKRIIAACTERDTPPRA